MIELEQVSYIYPHTVQKALNNLSFSLPRGKCVLVTGPSGAGKTTLCLASAGVLHHEYGGKKEGRVTLGGRDISTYSSLSEVARTIGIVFDDAEAQMIFTTVEEEILSALEYRGLAAEVVEDRLAAIMEKTHLTELRHRSPHHLSGGQKQRVALAATLALGNDILILDEPTSELDERATTRIVDILRTLKKEGTTILLIEHKFGHFKDIVDTLVVMENGMIRAEGSPDNVLADERMGKIVIADFSGIRTAGAEQNAGSVPDKNPAPGMVVSVKDLVYSYEKLRALDSINLEIAAGEFVAIVGENGSGKTTLVKHFNGLLLPESGTVTIAGTDTRLSSTTELSRLVGLVFQNPDHMFFADTVFEEVAFGPRNLNLADSDAIIRSALDEVNLGHTRDLYPRWLSRGERQRLAIACVIAMQPRIIILDEPTTGLDGNEARQVMTVLKKLQKKGHTIIIITHNKEIAENCADRILRMESGRIISDTRTGGA
ncbi:energy-coupling factor transporter ATPase [uncultured Methanoregula sp.]|uniref:ABC transporter ATP-binding protein n=1 Tax=uncultured Methanoregula sp. TaxID=1005933 RepID=UPI002AAA9111|nr:energy-coupling factor transporter ATPase [uncultured Methanoregula sp.]